MKIKFLVFSLSAITLAVIAIPAHAQTQFFIGVDSNSNFSSHTIDDNSDGADTAFHNWAAAVVGGSNHLGQWSGTGTPHASGILSGTGSAKLVMDTGVNATSPFGAAPTINIPPPNAPITRNYGSSFSYTVYNVLYANNDPATWANNPGLGTNLMTHIAGTSSLTTLAQRHVAGNFHQQYPANQDGDNVTPDGREVFGFAGVGVTNSVGHLSVSGLNSTDGRKSGFVLEFSNPISAFGVFAADFEATSEGDTLLTAGRWKATAFFYNSDKELIHFESWGNPFDGDKRESFMGIKRDTADIKYAMFIVGARSGLTSDTGRNSSARQNHYAFGAFTFVQAEIPEPRVYAVMAVLALCIGWRERRRLLALIKKIKPTPQPSPS